MLYDENGKEITEELSVNVASEQGKNQAIAYLHEAVIYWCSFRIKDAIFSATDLLDKDVLDWKLTGLQRIYNECMDGKNGDAEAEEEAYEKASVVVGKLLQLVLMKDKLARFDRIHSDGYEYNAKYKWNGTYPENRRPNEEDGNHLFISHEKVK